MGKPYTADKRLYLTADRSKVVEEGHADAASLLVGVGGEVSAEDAERYGLHERKADSKAAAPAEDKAVAAPQRKARG